MSARDGQDTGDGGGERRFKGPRADDPRVVRSRAAAVDAAQTLFLRDGYAGTTMEDIAALAGLTKRTLYNNYGEKYALLEEVAGRTIDRAEEFARELGVLFMVEITPVNVRGMLEDLGRRLALAIVRPDVIALRRLLIGEARAFPALSREYYDRAPGQVLDALTRGFEHLGDIGLLRVEDPRHAAVQFAYLVAGEPLDRAMLVGTTPPREHLVACAREGVETFLARYGAAD